MKSAELTTIRMCDVLFALREARRVKIDPNKIQLQKFVYLMDSLSQVVGCFKPRDGHKTYKRGPYDQAIQNAVDCLAFRGFVSVTDVREIPSGEVAANYRISNSGLRLIDGISLQSVFQEKGVLVDLIGKELETYGWNRIVRLVYAEPTYVATRPRHWGVQLRPEDGLEVSTSLLIAILRDVISSIGEAFQPSQEWLISQVFAFLDDYDRNHATIPSDRS